MKRIVTLTAAATATAALLGAPAFAGGLSEPVVEAPVATPAPVPMPTPVAVSDWTGGYAGLSLGTAKIDADGDDDSSGTYGLFAGYGYDFGQFVLGGEYEYQGIDDLNVSGVDVDNTQRLKLRGGYDAGPALLYVTAGAERADTSTGDVDGRFAGVGVDYKLTEQFAVGAEYLAHDYDEVNGVDADGDSFALRGSFRF